MWCVHPVVTLPFAKQAAQETATSTSARLATGFFVSLALFPFASFSVNLLLSDSLLHDLFHLLRTASFAHLSLPLATRRVVIF